MNEFYGLLLTIVLGIFILIGSLIAFFAKNSNKFIKFSIGMALGVMIMLAIFDLFPEICEIFNSKYVLWKAVLYILLLVLLGGGLLKIFDIFVPHHNHEEDEECVEVKNLHHIGIVSSLALVLHNIVEGMAIYSVFESSVGTSLLLSFGIGLHNIPLGMVIAGAFYKSNKNKLKTLLISLGISLSTFLGGFIMFLLKNNINEFILGVLLCITLGMLIYIIFFELLPHVVEKKDRKISLLGFACGIVIIIFSLLL